MADSLPLLPALELHDDSEEREKKTFTIESVLVSYHISLRHHK